ncbi:MAG: CPBP family intramembrane metalloprotease [Lachnospiraceae bacterium]|nr:CPBP family intramembrane metalloprotease [Lachnospiraceae bacterium]
MAEELGWRGYLQDEIEKKCGSLMTPIFVGLIWTAWHYHFFILGTMEVPIMIFAFGCVAESYGCL